MALLQLFIIVDICLLNYALDMAPSKCSMELPSVGPPLTTVYLPSAIQCAAYCESYTTGSKATFTFEGNTCKIYKEWYWYWFGSSDPLHRDCTIVYTLYRRYCLVRQELSFSDASKVCRQISMSLVSLESEAEARIVYNFYVILKENSTLIWTSGHMGLFEGTQQYYWSGSNSSMTYNGWIKGNPSSLSSSNGVVLNATSPYWGHIDDTTVLRFICEGPF